MALAFEPDTAPDAIEATLAYIVDDGTKVFTETGGLAQPTAATAVRPTRAR